MKKKLLALAVLGIALIAGCGSPGEPIVDDLYTQNVLPGVASTYSVGSEDYPYKKGWYDNLSLSGENPLVLTGDGLVYLEFRPDVDFVTVRANGAPTWVTRGIVGGFSLPIWNAGGNVNEELYLDICAPNRYDGASDVYVHIHCWLDAANVDKNFNLEIDWNHWAAGEDIVPATTYTVTVETGTGSAAQYQSFNIELTLDYDINSSDPIAANDNIDLRLRRIGASADEVAGEVVVNHVGVIFRRDKLGSSTHN